MEHGIELGDLRQGVLDEILVDWDALNDIDDTLDVELAGECLGRYAGVLAGWERQMNFLDGQVLLD